MSRPMAAAAISIRSSASRSGAQRCPRSGGVARSGGVCLWDGACPRSRRCCCNCRAPAKSYRPTQQRGRRMSHPISPKLVIRRIAGSDRFAAPIAAMFWRLQGSPGSGHRSSAKYRRTNWPARRQQAIRRKQSCGCSFVKAAERCWIPRPLCSTSLFSMTLWRLERRADVKTGRFELSYRARRRGDWSTSQPFPLDFHWHKTVLLATRGVA